MVVRARLYLIGEYFAEIRLKHFPSKGDYIRYKGESYKIVNILHIPVDDYNSSFDLILQIVEEDIG